jgi:hypothetical protein
MGSLGLERALIARPALALLDQLATAELAV